MWDIFNLLLRYKKENTKTRRIVCWCINATIYQVTMFECNCQLVVKKGWGKLIKIRCSSLGER